MKTSALILAVLCLAGAATLTAQDKDKGKASTGQLIERLGDPDYETRKSAEKLLLGRGEKALEALRKSAENHDDPEVQWRAGRLIRRIQAGGKDERKALAKRDRGAKAPVAGPAEGEVKAGDRLARRRLAEDVLEQLDRAFGGHEFDGEVRKEIERVMEQLRKNMGGFEFRGGIDFGPGSGFSFRTGTNRRMKMQQGPDGVRVEITETGEDGKPKTKVYEADSMEAFKKKYPGVLGEDPIRFEFKGFPFRGDFQIFSPFEVPQPNKWNFTWGLREKELRKPGDRRVVEPAEQTDGKKLGFHVGAISPAIRDYLDLEDGLMVADVVDGTTAAKLGLRKGDIVIKVGDRRIRDVPDVARALDAIGDGKVTVRVIRRGREITLR